MNEVEIYQTADNQTQVEVRFEAETVWLSQDSISLLFQRERSVITKHIRNIFKEGELDSKSNVQKMHIPNSDKPTSYYNLEVIISIGYRVNSKRGIQFRQWATKRLKDYLVEGYAINQKRLKERDLELRQLKDGIGILRRAIEHEAKDLVDASSLASLLERFAAGLSFLDDYDHQTLDAKGKTERDAVRIGADEYRVLVRGMDASFGSSIFGMEKDQGFDSAIAQIYQSFDGKELYPSLEDKAATLFYLVVKNHAFVDGNKRIAAACFLYFLERNGMLTLKDGRNLIDNDTIAALTLFIAVSKPEEMDTVKKVVISLLNRKELP